MSTTHDTQSGALADRTAPRTYRSWTHPLWRRVLLTRETAVVALLVAVVLYSLQNVTAFDGPLTLTYLLLDTMPILLIALPMTLVIITGEIDLSVASVVGLSSVLVGVLTEAGLPFAVAGLLALVIGAVCGAFNGFLIAYVGLPSLAVTIGTLALYRGLAVGLVGTKAITDFPQFWTDLAKAKVGSSSVPLVTVAFLVLAVLFILLLHFTTFGRGVYDIGLNDEAARFTGVDVERTKFLLFVMAGAVSAFAGIFYTLRFGSARGDNATGLELQVIAAVLLGGVSIFGGRGKIPGVIAGVLLIGVISSALRLESVTVNVINIIIGLLLVASVISTSLLGWVSSLMARRNRQGSTTHRAGRRRRIERKATVMKLHSRRVTALAALGLSAAMVLSACGGSDDTTTDSGSGGGGGGDATTITFLPKNLGNPYFDTSDAGGKKAVDEFGGTYSEVGPQEASPDAQVQYINTVAQQGINGLVISANDPTAICDAINEARDAGTKVVTFDSDTSPECRDLFINQATAEGIAKSEVDLIAEQIGDSGEVAILSASANATNQNAWIDIMKTEIADNHPDMELVDVVYGDDDDQTSFDKTAALLQSHPNLKGIISPTTVGIAAAARYLSDSSYKGKVALTGLGTPNQMREYVKDGTVTAFALWNPGDLGYLAAYAAKALADGDITGAEGDSFEAGDLGSFDVGADGTVLLGEPFVFDAKNIGDFDF